MHVFFPQYKNDLKKRGQDRYNPLFVNQIRLYEKERKIYESEKPGLNKSNR